MNISDVKKHVETLLERNRTLAVDLDTSRRALADVRRERDTMRQRIERLEHDNGALSDAVDKRVRSVAVDLRKVERERDDSARQTQLSRDVRGAEVSAPDRANVDAAQPSPPRGRKCPADTRQRLFLPIATCPERGGPIPCATHVATRMARPLRPFGSMRSDGRPARPISLRSTSSITATTGKPMKSWSGCGEELVDARRPGSSCRA